MFPTLAEKRRPGWGTRPSARWRCWMFRPGNFGTAEFRGPARAAAGDGRDSAGGRERGAAGRKRGDAGALERIAARTRVEDWVWTREFAVPLVERQLNVRSLEGFGLVGHERGGDCGGRGAALRAHDAEERSAAY